MKTVKYSTTIRGRYYDLKLVRLGGCSLPNLNGTAVTYAYDSDGLRTKKTVDGVQYDYYYVDGQLRYEKKGSEYELYYRYDLDGNLVSAQSGDGTMIATFSVEPRNNHKIKNSQKSTR